MILQVMETPDLPQKRKDIVALHFGFQSDVFSILDGIAMYNRLLAVSIVWNYAKGLQRQRHPDSALR